VDLLARTLTAATIAVILLALVATSADATHTRGKCKKRGTTVAKNDSARVYERGFSLYACAWRQNEEEILDTETDDISSSNTYGNVVLRGRFVAWIQTSEDISCKADCPPGYDGTNYYVNVFDIAKGDGDTTTADPLFETLRLNTRGSAAWLETAGSDTHDVHAWDFQRTARVLDSGPIRRFRLRGRELSWLNAGVAKSATLR
jgi:hypothetical protein